MAIGFRGLEVMAMLVAFEDWFLQGGIDYAEELDHVPGPPKNVSSTGACGFDFCFKEKMG